MEFEWDEAKRLATIEKHGFDFRDVVALFEKPHLTFPGVSGVEARLIAVGDVDGVMVAAIYTWRGEAIRLVTARNARRDERRKYRALYS